MQPFRPTVSAVRPAPAPGLPLGAVNVIADIDRLAAGLISDTESVKRTLPDVAAEVLELCQQKDSDAARIEKTVSRDPFISAQLISMSNSALFAPRMPIVGVRDAVVRVGLDAVRDIVMMVVTSSTMYRLPGFDALVEQMRQRSMVTALASRIMARALRVQAEYAFLAGLLHDIGELVLLERCVKKNVVNAGLFNDAQVGPAIRERIAMHHTDAGASVCRVWRLPAGVVDSAAHHHRYRVEDKHYLGANLVAAADLMADFIGVGSAPIPMDASARVFADVGLAPERVEACFEELKKTIPALVSA